jgi:diketogulonate reductase-like aldo/keto reductase
MASPLNPWSQAIALNDGNSIPTVGLGVWQTPAGDTERAVSAALAAGHRHVETAAAYGSESEIGLAMKGAAAAGIARDDVYQNATVDSIADAQEKAPAQALIRWHVQLSNIVNPKSVNPERIVSNFDVFDFELRDQDMESIGSLADETRLGPDPRTFNFTGR